MARERSRFSLFLAVLAGCLVAINANPPPAVQKCSANNQLASMRILLTTYRNSTGHWNSQVTFNERGAENTIGNWQIQVDQNVLRCRDTSLETILHLTAPPTAASARPIGTPFPSECGHALPRHDIPSDYELFPGVGYYKFHPESLTWPAARKVCEQEGAHLLILNSEEENGVARLIYTRHPTAPSWFLTGILEQGVHAEWYTLFGVPLHKTGFSRIFPGENNALGPSDFGVMHRDGDYGDVAIQASLRFICEIDL